MRLVGNFNVVHVQIYLLILYLLHSLCYGMYLKLFIRTLISIFLSVKGTVENVDELVIRMRGIKAGFVCVYFERGNYKKN